MTEPTVIAALSRLEAQTGLILKGQQAMNDAFQAHVQQDHKDFQRLEDEVTGLKTQHGRFLGGGAVLTILIAAFATWFKIS